ncbi:hypothetical protein ACFVAV_25895 [Nocardia sp. NPDC057663]|uniref:hypothetical protein n=1 Tax=Nocardia sp. NPDC057663 TaxID=3346201 RepID=UPI00366DB4FD
MTTETPHPVDHHGDPGTREPPTARGSWLLGSTMAMLRDPLALGLRGYEECGDVVRYRLGPVGMRREIFAVNHPDGAAQVLDAATSPDYRKDMWCTGRSARCSATACSPARTRPGDGSGDSCNRCSSPAASKRIPRP